MHAIYSLAIPLYIFSQHIDFPTLPTQLTKDTHIEPNLIQTSMVGMTDDIISQSAIDGRRVTFLVRTEPAVQLCVSASSHRTGPKAFSHGFVPARAFFFFFSCSPFFFFFWEEAITKKVGRERERVFRYSTERRGLCIYIYSTHITITTSRIQNKSIQTLRMMTTAGGDDDNDGSDGGYHYRPPCIDCHNNNNEPSTSQSSQPPPPPPPPRIFENGNSPSLESNNKNSKKLFLHIENHEKLSLAIPNNTLIIPSNIKSPSDQIINQVGYPNGPCLVYSNNIYLYSEPNASQAKLFDVVINVAKEVKNPLLNDNPNNDIEYIFIPWDHNSNLMDDLYQLTSIIDSRSRQGKKILIHCQCGVSRSASLVVAYVMKKQNWDLNTAYNYVKSQSPNINPNMSLMFQLIDWQAAVVAAS